MSDNPYFNSKGPKKSVRSLFDKKEFDNKTAKYTFTPDESFTIWRINSCYMPFHNNCLLGNSYKDWGRNNAFKELISRIDPSLLIKGN
jgi:hypothetical protein